MYIPPTVTQRGDTAGMLSAVDAKNLHECVGWLVWGGGNIGVKWEN